MHRLARGSCMRRADCDNPEMFRTVQNFIENSGEKKNLTLFVAVSLNELNMYFCVYVYPLLVSIML